MDNDGVDKFPPWKGLRVRTFCGEWCKAKARVGYMRGILIFCNRLQLPLLRGRVQILRQTITETKTISRTTASPSSFGFGDFDARIFREVLSFPELLDSWNNIFSEFMFYFSYFCFWIFFLFSSGYLILYSGLMFLDPFSFSFNKILDKTYAHPHRSTSNELTLFSYLEREGSARGTDESVVRSGWIHICSARIRNHTNSMVVLKLHILIPKERSVSSSVRGVFCGWGCLRSRANQSCKFSRAIYSSSKIVIKAEHIIMEAIVGYLLGITNIIGIFICHEYFHPLK